MSLLSHAAWWRLIDDGPEDPQLLDRIDELVEINWLDHIGVDAKPVARHHVLLLVGRGEDDDRNHAQLLIGLICCSTCNPSTLGNFRSSSRTVTLRMPLPSLDPARLCQKRAVTH